MIDLLEVQNAIIEAIRADAGCLAAFDAANTFSNIPENADSMGEFARVDMSAVPWDTKGDEGEEVRVEIHLYVQETSSLKTLKAKKALRELLNRDVSLPIDSGTVVCCEYQSFNNFQEPDGKTRHSVNVFRLLVTP